MKTLSTYYEDLVLSSDPNMFCMLKPGFAKYKDEFEKLLKLNGWKIIACCTKKFNRPEIEDFYIMHKDKPFYHKLCDYMITDDCICYTCYKNCNDPIADMKTFKDKIRKEWGIDEMKNGMHSSDSKENVLRESILGFAVNEKLKVKVPNVNVTECPITYKEFYNKIKRYVNSWGAKTYRTATLKRDNPNIEMPKYLFEAADNYIFAFQPNAEVDDELKIGVKFTNTNTTNIYRINITELADNPVDFMESRYTELIMKTL